MELFTKVIEELGTSINLRMSKHNLLSSNIANADIPNYRGFDLLVEETLKASSSETEAPFKKTHPLHMDPMDIPTLKIKDAPYIRLPDSEAFELDISKMMSELAENSIKYQATIEFLNRKLGSLRYAIEGK